MFLRHLLINTVFPFRFNATESIEAVETGYVSMVSGANCHIFIRIAMSCVKICIYYTDKSVVYVHVMHYYYCPLTSQVEHSSCLEDLCFMKCP